VREILKAARRRILRLAPRLWMRSDWNRRARDDAQFFIACGHSGTDATFWESGRRDLEDLILHDVDLEPQARALEIGCGLGRLVRPLSERVEKAFGVDISGQMVERARRALQDRGNAEFFVTNGRLSSFRDASLDFVYSFIVFQHVPTKKAVSVYIREAARVLKGRGLFRFQVDGRPRKRSGPDTWLGVWYDSAELLAEVSAAGFEPISLWGEHTHYLWMTALRRSEPGRPDSAAVRVRRRAWRREEVEALICRLGVDGAAEAAEAVLAGRKSPRQLAQPFLEQYGEEEPEAFVRRSYRVLLGREADAGGLSFYAKEIAGGIPRSNTVDCLLASSEMEERLRPETTR